MVWPVVESALLEHDMSGELVDNCMRVSTTEKTRDPKVLDKAKGLTRLLARNFPARLNVLHVVSEPHNKLRENFYKRRGRPIGPEKSTLKCSDPDKGFSVPATGSSEGLQVVKRIVDDCFQNGTSPASLIWLERRRKVADKITVDNPFYQIGIRPSIDVGRPLFIPTDIDMLRIGCCQQEFVKTQLICCEHTHKKFSEALHQGHFRDVLEMIQDTDVLEKIAEKFSSWVMCLYMLDPTRLNSRTYENFGGLQITHGSVDTANSETVVGMLEIVGKVNSLVWSFGTWYLHSVRLVLTTTCIMFSVLILN
ncbi:hypothetical protein DVH24_000646 [Malus domestica]|uniref:KRR-R motif-containing protein 1 n=1 Tax=Malus domestica TaxID=3750 RepID=A0A498J365_MALDO|nr:hypothetical protein DVH24_000646 [Malus domestica]